MIVTARFVAPVDGPPIENGAVHFENGRIISVGPASQIPARGAVDYGDAVILPGLVNAHTHLELSLLAGRVPPSNDFIDWLNRLITARTQDLNPIQSTREQPVSASPSPYQGEGRGEGKDARIENDRSTYFKRAVQVGIAQSVSSGVTTIGDITAFPHQTRPVLARSPLRAVSFGEVIAMGKGRHLLPVRLAAATNLDHQTDRLRIGISPHSPYSVEPRALRICGEKAREYRLPICIHVAETAKEERFTLRRLGPFVDFLFGLGLWDDDIPKGECGPVELVICSSMCGPRTILAHANYVWDTDIMLIAGSGASVAYCPRTHAAFGHPPHRFRDMLRAGVNVCLGTDSLASNPSLSILDELRFLHSKCHDVTPDELLALGTIRGARALGFGEVVGSLAPGKSADLVVIPLSLSAREWHVIFETSAEPLAVYIHGTPIDTP